MGGDDLEQGQHRNNQDRGLKETRRTKEKEIEGHNIHDDRPQDQEPKISQWRKHKANATQDFEDFDERQKTTHKHASHKHRSRGVVGRFGNRDKFEEKIQPEDDENQAQKGRCEVNDVFHIWLDELDRIPKETQWELISVWLANFFIPRRTNIPRVFLNMGDIKKELRQTGRFQSSHFGLVLISSNHQKQI